MSLIDTLMLIIKFVRNQQVSSTSEPAVAVATVIDLNIQLYISDMCVFIMSMWECILQNSNRNFVKLYFVDERTFIFN